MNKHIAPLPPAGTQIDVATLLTRAVEKGLDVETIERLLAMRQKLQDEAAERAYWAGLLEFQRRCPAIPKDKPVYDKHDKYLYSYAPIETIRKVTDPLLAELGFVATANTRREQGGVTIMVTLAHVDGHKQASEFFSPIHKAPLQSDQQAQEGAVTLAFRVAYRNVLGLTTGMLDDNTESLKDTGDDKSPATPTGRRIEAHYDVEDAPSATPLPTIGNGTLKRKIEAVIGEWGLDREVVKVWMKTKTGVSHFPDLNQGQAERLLDALPRQSKTLMLASIAAAPMERLERLDSDPPKWITAAAADWYYSAISNRLKSLSEAPNVPPGPDSEPLG